MALLLVAAGPARADRFDDIVKKLQEGEKPIADPAFFTFREAIFAVDDDLCRRFVGSPGDFRLPDWQLATSVFDTEILSGRPRPYGYWVYLDIANDGKKMVVHAENYGDGTKGGGGQIPIVLDMREGEFLSANIRLPWPQSIIYDSIHFRSGSRLAPHGYYRVQHPEAPAFSQRGIEPRMDEEYYTYTTPVLIGGSTYFVVRGRSRGNGKPGTVHGVLFRYLAPGKVDDLCYFID